MKTQYFTACSLDGFIATEDHSLEWLFPLANIEETGYPDFIEQVGALAMGSSTYEWMLQHAVKLGTDEEGAWPYQQPCWVFSSRELPAIPGADLHFVQGDVRPVHAEMAQACGGKNIWIIGGGDLVGQFLDAGLLDEIFVQKGSVLLGSGKPFLPRKMLWPSLKLVSAKATGAGLAELHYEVMPKS